MTDFDEWPSYPDYPTYPPTRAIIRFDTMTPLDDELSDLRWAPREVLIRAIRALTLQLQEGDAMCCEGIPGDARTYSQLLAEHNLQDSERNEQGAA